MLIEQALIAPFRAAYPQYIGDDAAVLPGQGDRCTLLTTDMLTESVHFRTQYFSPAALAHKALQVNLSDIAAMGGQPQYVLLSVGIPPSRLDYMQAYQHAFVACCQRAGVLVIGGDTVCSPAHMTLNLVVIGQAQRAHIKYRSGAKPGDRIYVAGDLGKARVGLYALEKHCAALSAWRSYALSPTARIQEGQWLAQHAAVTSMMDVSDGLVQDLSRLCDASGVHGQVNWHQCAAPLMTEDMQAAARIMGVSVPDLVLAGGEDYSLLLTVSPAHADALAVDFHRTHGYALSCLGQITQGRGVSVLHTGTAWDDADPDQRRTLGAFSHFGGAL